MARYICLPPCVRPAVPYLLFSIMVRILSDCVSCIEWLARFLLRIFYFSLPRSNFNCEAHSFSPFVFLDF
uniref:Putative secreted protein n=1 Tax=Anopheles marajoara TaxID=58244 RepID=A0A2M4CEN0_9DIPT